MQTQTSNTLHNAIMEAGSKDRAPMLTPGNYVQWKSRIKRYIDTKPNHELIHHCLKNPPYKFTWADMEIPISKVQIILTGIDNDINSTVEACPNACEMWNAIERLKQGESINVRDLETNLYWEFGKFISQDGESLESYYSRLYKMMNELIRNQCDVTNHQDKEIDKLMSLISLSFKKIYKPTNNNLRTSSNTSRTNQDNSLRINRSDGYENQRIGNVARARETVGSTVKPKRVKDAAYHKEKMLLCKQEEAGIQLNAEQVDWRDYTDDDELEDQELEAYYMYMAQLQEVSPDAADSGPIFDDEPLQKVSIDDHYNVFDIESEHPEQSESVHNIYPIEQDAHNVIIDSLDMSYNREEIDQNDNDNDLAKECELLPSLIEKLKCEIDESKNRNKFLETSNKVLVEKLKGEIKDFKNKNKRLESSNNRFKEANNKLSETNNLLYTDFKKSKAELARRKTQIKLYKIREDKELDKVIALENKVKVLDNIVYKTGQSVQTMNMLNNNCRTSFAKPEFLKKAQRPNPRLYDIGCYNDNLALMLAPESDEVIRLEKESRSKLSDLIRPFDYDKLNNLYNLFIPQREKSSEQIYFSERSRLSHISVNNGNSKESFNNQATLLEKRMDESIPWDKKCQSSIENFKVKTYVNTILNGVELCKEKIAQRAYSEKLYAKFSKCEFWIPKIQFISHVIDSRGIHVDPAKIESIKDWASPKTSIKILH
nr:reverse transcriptase domain-containing protein [Tanacetum cinerariifolium]